jgi:prepilin-type N-terminal cleavage/methylation domain-containing protein/prepilin-type processing-associated H-X9-DG protein
MCLRLSPVFWKELNMKYRNGTNKNRAFTLIELLVVISIIALLLSILMPSLGKAKRSAQSVVCRSNLKQINMAAVLWSEDHDGWALGAAWSWPDPAPYGGSNETSLQDYAQAIRNQTNSNIFACPSAKHAGFFGVRTGSTTNGMDTLDPEVAAKTITYGINAWIATAHELNKGPGDTAKTPQEQGNFGEGPGFVHWYEHGVTRISNIHQPASIAYFIDHEIYLANKWNFDPLTPPDQIRSSATPKGCQSRWHDRKSGADYGYGNIAWVDGHVSKEPKNLGQEPEDASLDPHWKRHFGAR